MDKNFKTKIVNITYLAVIENADFTCANINLDYDLKFEVLPFNEGLNLLCKIENNCINKAFYKIMDFCVVQDNKVVVIRKTVKGAISIADDGYLAEIPKEMHELNNNENRYIGETFELMRLFKEGNIRKRITYLYYEDNGVVHTIITSRESNHAENLSIFRIDENELEPLQNFLKKTHLTLTQPYVNSAHRQYELSYKQSYGDRALALVLLTTALEILILNSKKEITYKLAKNVANLLGDDIQKSKKIFKDIKKLYNKRSIYIHKGSYDHITDEDVLVLRSYTRDIIKYLIDIKISKDETIKRLEKMEYGDKNKLMTIKIK